MELTQSHTGVKCLPAKFQREAEDLFLGCRTLDWSGVAA
jgi:hypothetical protein